MSRRKRKEKRVRELQEKREQKREDRYMERLSALIEATRKLDCQTREQMLAHLRVVFALYKAPKLGIDIEQGDGPPKRAPDMRSHLSILKGGLDAE